MLSDRNAIRIYLQGTLDGPSVNELIRNNPELREVLGSEDAHSVVEIGGGKHLLLTSMFLVIVSLRV